MEWYAIRTQNNKEKSVVEKLNLELDRSGLKSMVGRCLIPTEKALFTKNGKKYSREKTVYPGYIFVETNAVGEVSNILRGINGASGFVRTKSGTIHPLKESEVNNLLMVDDIKKEVNQAPNFVLGDDVRITEGPFDSFKGKVDQIDEDKHRVKVGVLIFGRMTSIDLTYDQVERIY